MSISAAIPVIDLFAGPGGLAEGISSVTRGGSGERAFDVRLSIEKDPVARKTLLLRAFTRQFRIGNLPPEYYAYLRSDSDAERAVKRVELEKKYPDEFAAAEAEAWLMELGQSARTEVSERIDAVLGEAKPWVLIGGPPCQAYSLVGRSRMLREMGEDKFFADERHTLYHEYLYILARHRPDVFIMENVKGVLSSRLDNDFAFRLIRRDLARPTHALNMGGEEVEYELFPVAAPVGQTGMKIDGQATGTDFIVQCEDHGIPQARHRVIILGVRKDRLPSGSFEIQQLVRTKSSLSVYDAISDLPPLRSGLSKEKDSSGSWSAVVGEVGRSPWVSELVDSDLRKQLSQTGRSRKKNLGRGAEFIEHPLTAEPGSFISRLVDTKLGGVCNHTTRGHIREDLYRYVFASTYAALLGTSPKMADFPGALLPNHQNVGEAVAGKMFSDRFRVQLRDRPSGTITSHIAKDGHYFIHYDPEQARSFTVREAARIQTFPDNYFFEGPRTEQYKQVGNAVPPLLAKQIAEVVRGVLVQLDSVGGQADARKTKLEHGKDRRKKHAS